MDVILDGEARTLDVSTCANLAELVAMAERTASSAEDAVVVAIEVDGEPLGPDELGVLEGRPLDGIARVAIERRPTLVVARSVLRQGGDYSAQIQAAIDETVGHFRGGRSDVANQWLADVTDSLTVLTGISSSVAVAMPRAAEALAEVQGELFPWLEELVAAQSAQDPLAIADLLEYEIRDRVDRWGRVMHAEAAAEATDERSAAEPISI